MERGQDRYIERWARKLIVAVDGEVRKLTEEQVQGRGKKVEADGQITKRSRTVDPLAPSRSGHQEEKDPQRELSCQEPTTAGRTRGDLFFGRFRFSGNAPRGCRGTSRIRSRIAFSL